MNSPSNQEPSGIRIRVQLSDGSAETFIQPDDKQAKAIWEKMNPAQLFTQQRLVIAGTHSKSVFVMSEIVRIDCSRPPEEDWQFPEGLFDMVELSEMDFRKSARLDHPELMPKREQLTPAGNLLVSFLKLYFRNNPPVFLMAEVSMKLPVENQSYMRFLLSKTAFHVRLAGGGVGVINLAHLAGFAVYPGIAQVPSDSWEAEPLAEEST
jgi:hypothetical protein